MAPLLVLCCGWEDRPLLLCVLNFTLKKILLPNNVLLLLLLLSGLGFFLLFYNIQIIDRSLAEFALPMPLSLLETVE